MRSPGTAAESSPARLPGEISITSDMQMTPPLMAESEEELKSLLTRPRCPQPMQPSRALLWAWGPRAVAGCLATHGLRGCDPGRPKPSSGVTQRSAWYIQGELGLTLTQCDSNLGAQRLSALTPHLSTPGRTKPEGQCWGGSGVSETAVSWGSVPCKTADKP